VRRVSADWEWAALAGGLSLGGAAVVLRLWQAHVGVPFEYFGDVNLQHLLVRSVLENGWFYENSWLGAPSGQELYDYPVLSGDTLNVVALWILGLFGLGSAAALNLFYVLTFPAAGMTAYLVLRRLGAERGPALVCAVLYALAPYHFIRGETHVWLAAYYAVPVGAYLALAVIGGDDLIGGRRRLFLTGALAALVAVASGSFYYSAFTVVLVVVAALLRLVATRESRSLLPAGFVVSVLIAVSLVQLTPTIAYQAVNGRNEVAKRFSHESEVYSLKLSQLVFPLDDYRIDAIGRVKRRYSAHFPPGDARAATLGIVATAGLAWLFAVAFAALVGRRPRGRHANLAALTLAAFLFATVGGFGTLAASVWSQTRAWNRLSIFIAFFALTAVALGLGALGRRLGRMASVAVLAAVLVVGVFDQTSNAFIPAYDAVEAQWKQDATFVDSLENRLPEKAMVMQLPYETFPEPPAGRQAIYEPVKPYLHSHDLRWSYGAMRGRPADWLAAFADRPVTEVVRAARERGFAGLLMDRLGYPDDGAALEAELRAALGAQPTRSANGRFLFWPL
jgi:phosphoglycerol transferase